jgi:hypothetical protein
MEKHFEILVNQILDGFRCWSVYFFRQHFVHYALVPGAHNQVEENENQENYSTKGVRWQLLLSHSIEDKITIYNTGYFFAKKSFPVL